MSLRHVANMSATFAAKDLTNFVIAQVADSTALNPKIACMLGIKHIACCNHCLNLGCKDIKKHCSELKKNVDLTQEVHCKVKASNKLTVELENVNHTNGNWTQVA